MMRREHLLAPYNESFHLVSPWSLLREGNSQLRDGLARRNNVRNAMTAAVEGARQSSFRHLRLDRASAEAISLSSFEELLPPFFALRKDLWLWLACDS